MCARFDLFCEHEIRILIRNEETNRNAIKIAKTTLTCVNAVYKKGAPKRECL